MRVVFLGGPWHDQVHDIPDSANLWETPVLVTVGDDDPAEWREVADSFVYVLHGDMMVPALAAADDVAELLAEHRRSG